MKIKYVCELTGLSDRTVRYYIEQNLISPSYSENYLGRRTYDFSQNDIKELNDIAVLRKFDFTIEEIKNIINDPEASKTILCNVRSRTENAVCDGQEKLSALSQISTEKACTVAALAEELSKSSAALPDQNETIRHGIVKTILPALKMIMIFTIVWSPFALSLLAVITDIKNNHYPVFNPIGIALTLVFLLPSIALLNISKIRSPWKRIIKRYLLVLCAYSIPISFVMSRGIITRSETTDFRNYRDFDADCLANRDSVFQELFPAWPHYFENVKQADGSYKTVYLDAHYFYRYRQGIDYTFDIYAEWPLGTDEYIAEVNRATAVFEKYKKYKFTKLTKGDYSCLILYYGDEPFNKATDNYDYIIFACNETDKTVRYIYCSSLENGVDQPYYLQLDW